MVQCLGCVCIIFGLMDFEVKLKTSKAAYYKKWWARNRDRVNKTLKTTLVYRYRSLKARCKRENRRFSISFKRYKEMILAGCYYCGADLSKEVGGGVDRLNNSNRNYFTRGVVACCKICNKVKSDQLSPQEMLVAMKAIKQYRKGKKKHV